ncbi:MAG: alpha/beta fold hydrolase [Nevskia sp.]|nr:alpha/beta fold hydrolase [Nevskia sp.]
MSQKRRSRPRHPVSQTRGGVELAGGVFDQLSRRIHQFHRAISDIPFDRLAAAPVARIGSQPTRLLHDGITDSVYAVVRATGGLAFGLAALALKRAELQLEKNQLALQAPGDSTAAPAPAVLRDNVLISLNGAFGDFMAARRNPLSVQLGFYHHGTLLDLQPEVIAAAHAQITPRVVIFLHGLCCNEHSWRIYADPDAADSTPYGDRLAAEHGYTPFYLRYNTGLHISQNGRSVARLIGKLVANYPGPLDEIVLVGHSMGGLVARSACYYGQLDEAAWTSKVTQLVCLGTPHLGAPLEQAVHLGTAVMDAFKLSRPWAGLLKLRSLGIKDLRHGYASHTDWRGTDADASFENRRSEIPRLPHARYHFIGSSIGESESRWLGRLIGDGLVRLPSSTAHELADADTAVLYRTHHLRLLNHPVVYQQLVQRLVAAERPSRSSIKNPKKASPRKARKAR